MGTYASGVNSSKCTSAAPGFYVGKTGEIEEKECEAGTYTNAEGQSSCLDARPGYYVSDVGTSPCRSH